MRKSLFVNWAQLNPKTIERYYLQIEDEHTSLMDNFFVRMTGEMNFLQQILTNFKYFVEKSLIELSEKRLGLIDNFKMILAENEKENESQYHFHKIVLLWTEFNTLFALDSKNGEIIWKLNLFVEFS